MSIRWNSLHEVEEEIVDVININNNGMIEHSINKHDIQTQSPQQYTQPPTQSVVPSLKTTWPIAKYKDYLLDLEKRNFKVGAPCITKYGITGKIAGYKDWGTATHITFYNNGPGPDVLRINRDDLVADLYYNEAEIKLLGESK